MEEKFPRELLIHCKSLQGYGLNPDILGALLTESHYTLSAAKQVIETYIASFKE